jgi:two-component system chemotaxis response regulator CheB
MDDGAAGLAAVGRAGGLALVQDPAEALFPGMPAAAIEQADPQLIAPLSELARRVGTWLADRDGEAALPQP